MSFDEPAAHKFFAADCFNRAWDLIEKPNRSADDDQQMLLLAQASLWHWTRRADCTDRNLSIGYWQLARVYALLAQADNAMQSARRSLSYSENESAFFLAYAHEAIARAALVAGDSQTKADHLAEARRLAAQVADAQERAALEKDLETIR